MFHNIDTDRIGQRGEDMAQAVQACVHCGFCLPTCPTYQVLGEEADSPRGRIVLMKHVLEGNLTWKEVQPQIDRCLGCLACETACPSGVAYGHLLSPFRDWVRRNERVRPPSPRRLLLNVLPYPTRFRWALRVAKWTGWLSRFAPKSMRPMLSLVPKQIAKSDPLIPGEYPAEGSEVAHVALLAGCAQQVLNPAIHRSALRVLNRNGVRVTVPKEQQCCGALAWHTGHGALAMRFARANLAAFGGTFDAILSTAAGCGSALREYPVLLRGEPDEAKANQLAGLAMDVLTFLGKRAIASPPPLPRTVRVAYHDACHLAHAQREKKNPRSLLEQIPNLQLVPLREADLCCGSAGSYNIDQPEIAAELGFRKANHIIESGCELVALANIGCQVQIEQALKKLGRKTPVLHVVQVIDLAYQGRLIEALPVQ